MLETAAGRVDVSAAVTEAVAAVMRQRGLDAGERAAYRDLLETAP